ncbi:hypothetical protein ZWY2020_037358 [Hordeum vulgare]|nr:hypothetical protein ZWY2020_037358 [Hordeum vulgare]
MNTASVPLRHGGGGGHRGLVIDSSGQIDSPLRPNSALIQADAFEGVFHIQTPAAPRCGRHSLRRAPPALTRAQQGQLYPFWALESLVEGSHTVMHEQLAIFDHDVSGVPNALEIAVEPSTRAELKVYFEGLMLLNQADPFVEYTVSTRAEHTLAAADSGRHSIDVVNRLCAASEHPTELVDGSTN